VTSGDSPLPDEPVDLVALEAHQPSHLHVGQALLCHEPAHVARRDVDDGLARVLRSQRKLQAEERLAAQDYVDSDYVFTRPTGGPYHPNNLSKLLGRMTTEVGLPRLTAHGLRHTSATLMLANGVPPKVAAEGLGHADATLFTNLYSHVTPTMQRAAADKIGAALFG
jgi:integrase